jgi:hypothetical protein
MDRILGGIDSEDQGNEQASGTLYHRSQIVLKKEKDENEFMWLGKGIATEVEKIKKYTTEEYLILLKYTIEQRDNGRRSDNS